MGAGWQAWWRTNSTLKGVSSAWFASATISLQARAVSDRAPVRLKCPALIVQNDRDPFGSRSEVEARAISCDPRSLGQRRNHDLGHAGPRGSRAKVSPPQPMPLRLCSQSNGLKLFGLTQPRRPVLANAAVAC
jgi:hypothetical protein